MTDKMTALSRRAIACKGSLKIHSRFSPRYPVFYMNSMFKMLALCCKIHSQ